MLLLLFFFDETIYVFVCIKNKTRSREKKTPLLNNNNQIFFSISKNKVRLPINKYKGR